MIALTFMRRTCWSACGLIIFVMIMSRSHDCNMYVNCVRNQKPPEMLLHLCVFSNTICFIVLTLESTSWNVFILGGKFVPPPSGTES